jgi:hypothetical protein
MRRRERVAPTIHVGGYMCHMRRRERVAPTIYVSYEEEDTCVI